MAQENIKLKLPSGIEAELRSFTKRKDWKAVERAQFGEQIIDVEMQQGGVNGQKIPMKLADLAVDNETDTKILVLLEKLGEKVSDFTPDDVEDLAKADYEVMAEEANKIFAKDDPEDPDHAKK